MANLFIKQAKQYSASRPTYPSELYTFIASKTPCRDLVWDVATGSGQAAIALADIYKNVVATDTSSKQLEYAPIVPNVRYQHTSPSMSYQELQTNVAKESTVDLVTVAQAIHWFDLPQFYEQVKFVLKKPNGVIAVWSYPVPKTNEKVDAVFDSFLKACATFMDQRAMELSNGNISENQGIKFPFEAVDKNEGRGPFEFVAEKVMNLEDYLAYVRSKSGYNAAKEKGVELLNDDLMDKFRCAWDDDRCVEKVVRFPFYLRIGKVGNLS